MRKRTRRERVSIPFKRESIYKGRNTFPKDEFTQFQFPSNGKAYTKTVFVVAGCGTVTAFQFPSNGKVYSEQIYVKNDGDQD